jgi:dTDP-4-amino-4,6-dideoxygalactose transaminase
VSLQPLAKVEPAVRSVPFARTPVCDEARAAVAAVLDSGWLTTGQQVADFEREFAEYVGAPQAVAVSSCTAALELALRGMRLPAGSKVLISANTFCGAAHAIIHAGLVPVLVDVDDELAMPTPATTAAAVAAAGGVEAMVVVHLGGLAADVRALAASADLPLTRVVEDAAHALGTVTRDGHVGALSRATCFSFYATKNLPIGEGGMLTTGDSELADAVQAARLHGMTRDAWRRYLPGGGWKYDVLADGVKANMTDVQAAIGRAQLRHLAQWQAARRRLAARYDLLLEQVGGIRLPPRSLNSVHAWHLYSIRIDSEFGLPRDAVRDRLAESGIGSSVHFIPLHQLTWFSRNAVIPPDGLPGADEVFARTLSLPFHPLLSNDDVDAVCVLLASLGGAS